MARAASQLLGKLSMDAHACRERLPGTHTFTGGTGVGVQSHVDFFISEDAQGSAACYPLSAKSYKNRDKSVNRVNSSLSAVSLVLS